jgi:hypothetical protein
MLVRFNIYGTTLQITADEVMCNRCRLHLHKSGQNTVTFIHKKWTMPGRIQGNNVMIEVIRGVDGCNNNIHYFMKKYHYHNKYLPARKKEMDVSLRGFSPFSPGCFHIDHDPAGEHMPMLRLLLSRCLI